MAPTRHTLLLVDDEENIHKALRRVFRREDYEILTAGSGEEALALLATREVSLIISDQRMPGMIGAEFLGRARRLQPHALRIMLTGYSDIEAAQQAINEGEILRFLTKPWDDDELRLTVRDALQRLDLEAENRRLAEELGLRNRQLQDANERLEREVAARTRELRLRVQELEARDRIAQHMLSVQPLESTLALVAEVVADVFGFGRACVCVVEDGTPRPRAAIEAGRAVDPQAIPGGERRTAACARALADGAPVHVPDAAGDDPGFAAVPILRADERLGLVVVDNPADGRPVDADEVHVLHRLSVLAAVAIADARSHGNLEEWRAQLSEVLDSVDDLDGFGGDA